MTLPYDSGWQADLIVGQQHRSLEAENADLLEGRQRLLDKLFEQPALQLEIERLQGLLAYATDTDAYRTLRAKNEKLEAENKRQKRTLDAIATHPDTPGLIKKYAAGQLG